VHRAEVIAVGGSVAGCATALHLAARGHDVLVVERARFPREKVCGEGLMPHGLEALERLGLDALIRGIAHPFFGIAYTVPGATAVGRFPGGAVGLGVRRSALDAALLEACRRHPKIEVHTGTRVRSVAGVPGWMEVRTDGDRWTCRAVVGADGLHSGVRRQLGLAIEPTGRLRYGARAHFDIGEDLDFVEVHVVPGAELYLTPVGDGVVNVAVLCEREVTRSFGGDLQGGFKALVLRSERVSRLVDTADRLTEPTLCGPLRQDSRSSVAAGAVLVGDAAGFVDAITGEGMSLTLLSAEIAADVLSDGLRRGRLSARDLRPYHDRRRRTARDLTWLTEIILWGIRHDRLARRVVSSLAANPELFSRVLAVNSGHAPLSSIGIRGVARLLRG